MTAGDKTLAVLYQPRIRELAARVRSDRRLAAPDVTVTCRSPVCGSVITLDLRQKSGQLTGLGWQGRACTLGMASLALVTQLAIGERREDVAAAGAALFSLLHGEEVVFEKTWEQLSVFSAARDFPSRFDSIMLPFHAVEEGFEKLSLR